MSCASALAQRIPTRAPVVAIDCDVGEIRGLSLLNCSPEETVTDTITRIVDSIRVDLSEIIQQRQG